MRKAILILVILSCGLPSLASNDDSLNSIILQQYSRKIAESARQRTADSMKKEKLVFRMSSLKKGDTPKKEKIVSQIHELDEREAKRNAENKKLIDSLKQTAKSFPVKGLFGDTLFFIYTKIGSFSTSERAEAISTSINKIAEKKDFDEDSLRIVQAGIAMDLVYGELVIMSVSENDAMWNSSSKLELAKNYKIIIVGDIKKYQQESGVFNAVKKVFWVATVLGILGLLFFYINKFSKKVDAKIVAGKRITAIKIKNYTLLNPQKVVALLLILHKLLKWFVFGLLIYITLPVLLGLFPSTRNVADTILDNVLNPIKKISMGFWNYLPNVFTLLVIFVVFKYVLKVFRYFKNAIEKGSLVLRGFYPSWASPTYQIISVITFAFMLVVIFPYLPGSESPIFKGVTVFLGLLFTFSSVSSLSNVFSGLVTTYVQLYKIGDFVSIAGVQGEVIEKSLIVTRIKTIKNEIVSIPNSTIMTNHTINYSLPAKEAGLILHTTVAINYSVPWKEMHEALICAAERTEMILKDPKPYVLQVSLDDFYVTYQLNVYTREPKKQALIYSCLNQNIQDCCNEAGIEILSPHYHAIRDGNPISIPMDYWKKNFETPGLGVNLKSKVPQ